MSDLSKITNDELFRILREEPNGIEADAIIEELQRRWMRLLSRDFPSLGFAAHQDIAQNAWIRLQDLLTKSGSEIGKFWSVAGKACRWAALDWNRWKKGRRRGRGSGKADSRQGPVGRTRGVEVSLDSAELFDHGPSPEAKAILRQQIERIVDGFDKQGHPEALERLLKYDEEGSERLAKELGLESAATRKMIQRLREKAQKLRD